MAIDTDLSVEIIEDLEQKHTQAQIDAEHGTTQVNYWTREMFRPACFPARRVIPRVIIVAPSISTIVTRGYAIGSVPLVVTRGYG